MLEPSRPAYHLGAVVTAHMMVTVAIALMGAFWLSSHVPLHASAPVFAVFVVVGSILAAEPVRRKEQPERFGPANRITLARSLLVAAVACLIGAPPTTETATGASIVAIVALCMDGLDGWVARKTDSISAYGAQLDMELDSIFMMVLCIMVFDWDHAGPWVLSGGLARYGWLAVQSVVVWFRRPLLPAFRRKTACVVGVAGLALALAPWPWAQLNFVLATIATMSIVLSFGIDAVWLIRHRKDPLP